MENIRFVKDVLFREDELVEAIVDDVFRGHAIEFGGKKEKKIENRISELEHDCLDMLKKRLRILVPGKEEIVMDDGSTEYIGVWKRSRGKDT